MSESEGVSASSLAIVEKKPHKAGGCVGIFFRLFDWNRRFAKKQFFSNELLPPARAKQAAKKFGGDEKQPKLRLFADENSGGFPNAKKNGASTIDSVQKQGVKTPNLVARLMGLEAMPTAQPGKLSKASSSEMKGDRREKVTTNGCEFGRGNQDHEKGGAKHEVRPPKLQKTDLLERRPVTRFGSEAFHLKNVLSRSRKQNHPKLVAPVKSPRNLSGRNVARLMGAATRILEPGLQSRSRAKRAITYSHNMHHGSGDEFMSESLNPMSPESSIHYVNDAKSLKGQSSCTSCGNLLDVVHCRPNTEDNPSVFVSPSRLSEMSKSRAPVSSLDRENERYFQKRRVHSASLARAVENIRNHAIFTSEKMMPFDEGQVQGNLTGQHSQPQTSLIFNGYQQKTRRQMEVKPSCLQSNKLMSATNSVKETKDFVAMNRSLSGQSRSKVTPKVDEFKFDKRRKYVNKREESLSPGRRRRTMNVSRQVESSVMASSTPYKPKNEGSGSKGNDGIAFTFSSPMAHRGGIPSKGGRRDQIVSPCNSSPRKALRSVSDRNNCSQESFPLTGDTLGALLDKKLRELTSQEEDDWAVGGTQSKRASAIILQELIFALKGERLPPHRSMDCGPRPKLVSQYRGCTLNSKTDLYFQGTPKTAGASFGYSYEGDHLSPGCVLEASFSNDSCISSILDDSSGPILHADTTSCSYEEPQQLDFDSDVYYAGTSSKERTSRELVIDLLNHISEVLYSIDLVDAKLKGSKFNHAKEVILNSELVLGNKGFHNSHEIKGFSISSFLLNELETLASVMWTNFNNFLGFEDTKEGNQLMGFIFDCLIEYLDLRYCRYFKSGFGAWRSLPVSMNAEEMIYEVVEEVRRWTCLAAFVPDDLVESEMSHGLGKWTDFEIEAFETGAEIDRAILCSLVDEIVVDILDCNLWVELSCISC